MSKFSCVKVFTVYFFIQGVIFAADINNLELKKEKTFVVEEQKLGKKILNSIPAEIKEYISKEYEEKYIQCAPVKFSRGLCGCCYDGNKLFLKNLLKEDVTVEEIMKNAEKIELSEGNFKFWEIRKNDKEQKQGIEDVIKRDVKRAFPHCVPESDKQKKYMAILTELLKKFLQKEGFYDQYFSDFFAISIKIFMEKDNLWREQDDSSNKDSDEKIIESNIELLKNPAEIKKPEAGEGKIVSNRKEQFEKAKEDAFLLAYKLLFSEKIHFSYFLSFLSLGFEYKYEEMCKSFIERKIMYYKNVLIPENYIYYHHFEEILQISLLRFLNNDVTKEIKLINLFLKYGYNINFNILKYIYYRPNFKEIKEPSSVAEEIRQYVDELFT